MIQRLQTVFLFLAIVAMGLFLWMPLLTIEAAHYSASQQGWDVGRSMLFMEQYYRYYFNLIFTGTAIGFTLLAIFLYKKRNIQTLLCWFAIIFIVAAQAYVFYEYQTRPFIGDVILRKWNLFSAVAVVLEILAIVYIRKDEEKLKSLDRLR